MKEIYSCFFGFLVSDFPFFFYSTKKKTRLAGKKIFVRNTHFFSFFLLHSQIKKNVLVTRETVMLSKKSKKTSQTRQRQRRRVVCEGVCV